MRIKETIYNILRKSPAIILKVERFNKVAQYVFNIFNYVHLRS